MTNSIKAAKKVLDFKSIDKTTGTILGEKNGLVISLPEESPLNKNVAIFGATDSAVNNFTVGEVKIDLDEPSFPTPPPEDVPPGGEVEKDPQVENTGKNSAYVFIKVAAPKDTFIKAAADGTRIDKEAVLQELFLVKSGDGEFKSLADGYNQDKWELLPDYTDTKSSTEYNYYVFAYKSIVAKGETTATLFDKVKLENAVEGFIDNNHYEININAYAIQSENIPEDYTLLAYQLAIDNKRCDIYRTNSDQTT